MKNQESPEGVPDSIEHMREELIELMSLALEKAHTLQEQTRDFIKELDAFYRRATGQPENQIQASDGELE